jgi:translocator protein
VPAIAALVSASAWHLAIICYNSGMALTYLSALAWAVVLTVVMAGAEGVLSGERLTRWLASLKKPKLYAPMPVWITVAIATYFLQGVIAFRLLSRTNELVDVIATAVLVTVMIANVAYNVALARTQQPRVAYTGLIYFLLPLMALQVVLFFADPLSARLNLIYVAWVALYDLPIMRALWKLNETYTKQAATLAQTGRN